jgi:7,8-dihydro-6-hydroxymethylpterin dimethyltransferase
MTGPEDIVLEQISSLCSQCNKPLISNIVERNGSVFQTSTCALHGTTETEIFSNAPLYRKLNAWNDVIFKSFDQQRAVQDVAESETWLTSLNKPVLGVIDLTNRCNYSCPLCFANGDQANGFYYLDKENVREMLRVLLEQKPAPCKNIQFSGGEPTLHPDFPAILRMAQDMGFSHIQVATNGSRFLDKDFVSVCEDRGLHTLYLQFDGMSDDVYLKLRGKRLLDQKIAIVENITRTNMRIVLVPSIAASVNVDQLGPIFKFALQHSKHITGISIQPAAHVGRTEYAGADVRSFNLADMAIEFGNQTGLTRFPDDWFPLSAVSMITLGVENLRGAPLPHPACDAHCSLGTYFYVDERDNPTCLNHFINMEEFFKKMGALSPKGARNSIFEKIYRLKELKTISDCFNQRKAPDGLTFQRLLRGLDGWEDKSLGRGSDWNTKGYNGLFVAGMHFMDSGNYNLRRLGRCIIQYVTADGKLVPFCSYNSGLRYRTTEERNRQKGDRISSEQLAVAAP